MYTRKKSIYSGICFILILAATAITSCGRDSRFREELVSLDSVLAARPDSVYNVLADMRDEAMKQSVSDRMYYELMLADAQNKAYIDFTTDSVMKSVAEYYDNHGTANEKVRAYYLLVRNNEGVWLSQRVFYIVGSLSLLSIITIAMEIAFHVYFHWLQ